MDPAAGADAAGAAGTAAAAAAGAAGAAGSGAGLAAAVAAATAATTNRREYGLRFPAGTRTRVLLARAENAWELISS